MSAGVLPGNMASSVGELQPVAHGGAPPLRLSVALLLFLLCVSASTLCLSSPPPPPPPCFLLAVHRLEQHGARAHCPDPAAPRPGLAGRGAGHGGILRPGGQGAGLQSPQRPAVQHGPGPAEGSQTPHHSADREGRRGPPPGPGSSPRSINQISFFSRFSRRCSRSCGGTSSTSACLQTPSTMMT